jgi:soluble lytic murein transglycosylase-like protein
VPSPVRSPPAFQKASCASLGPEVAAYIEDRLRAASQALAGNTVQRHLGRDGVWHITSNSPAEPPAGLAQLAAATTRAPAAASGLPGRQTFPSLAWETGFGRPPPRAPERTVVTRRDHRGVLHIFSRAAVQVPGGRDSPVAFLRRVPPFLQFCIMDAAHLYSLPVPLVLALIRQESNFAPQAVSPKGAMGLMQLMPGTAALLGVRDPFAPRENILAGCRYFRFLLNCFQGSVPLALAAYNAGSQRVVSAGYRVPAIQETQEFVTRVMGLYCLLEKHAAHL